MNGNILIVDDDQSMAEVLSTVMTKAGFAITSCASAAEGLSALAEQDFDVVVTDLHMEGMDGFAFCERIVANHPDVAVVMVTAFGSMDSAVAAIRVGAYDFIVKPFDTSTITLTLQRAVAHRALRNEVKRLRQEVTSVRGGDLMIGSSPAILKIKEVIARVAHSDATLLIAGSSGTGKELVAQAVHQASRFANGPFVAINCAAVPETLLESELFGHVKGAFTDARTPRQGLFLKANGGTLFLDEIGEMPIAMQPKLLRALQEKTVRPVGGDKEIPYEARIITASNRDLETEVEERRFREDLYYRINVVRIDVPPLRVRGSDVLLLAQHFVQKLSEKSTKKVTGISAGVAEKLTAYSWPGNVRELQNCIERAVAFARFDELAVDDLPEKVRNHRVTDAVPLALMPSAGVEEVLKLDEVERRYVLRVLKQLDGNKTLAAELLGVDRRTLYRKLDRWDGATGDAPPADDAAVASAGVRRF
jgi:two-component system, NtrC family, response regulator AtoC